MHRRHAAGDEGGGPEGHAVGVRGYVVGEATTGVGAGTGAVATTGARASPWGGARVERQDRDVAGA